MSLEYLDDTTILITGGTGSWGRELTTQLLEFANPKQIRIYSRGEHKQVDMKYDFGNDDRLMFIIGDVRDYMTLNRATKKVDYVFHLSALKHVPVCEENPYEAFLTNVVGTKNVIDTSIENDVKRVIGISTDKAVDPLNTYGISKAMEEKLLINANSLSSNTVFCCIRGGNVIGTNGSVIPVFKHQIATNNEILITEYEMSRFFMTKREAVNLLFHAAEVTIGGETFVIKMPATKITRLAELVIEYSGKPNTKMRRIGIRPGEKLFEVLVSRYEVCNTYDYGNYFVILPQTNFSNLREHYKNHKRVDFEEYNSQNAHQLDRTELEQLLKKDGWI